MSPLPAPSGTGISFQYISNVSDQQFADASKTLDRALLREIGLPEEFEIRELENGLHAVTIKLQALLKNFTIGRLIAVLPEVVIDAAALWEKVQPKVAGKMERSEFITKVVRYVYRKHNPDIPFLVEPFETMVEEMVIGAVPDVLEVVEAQLEGITKKLKSLFS